MPATRQTPTFGKSNASFCLKRLPRPVVQFGEGDFVAVPEAVEVSPRLLGHLAAKYGVAIDEVDLRQAEMRVEHVAAAHDQLFAVDDQRFVVHAVVDPQRMAAN